MLIALAFIEIPGSMAVVCQSEDGISLEFAWGGGCMPISTPLGNESSQPDQEGIPCNNCNDAPLAKVNLYRPESKKNTHDESPTVFQSSSLTTNHQDTLQRAHLLSPRQTRNLLPPAHSPILLI